MRIPPQTSSHPPERKSRKSRRWRIADGFSLVEVTMALGIVSFALLPLMALLPVGLSSFRDSIGISREAQLVQTIANSLQQAPFASIQQMENSPATFSFDWDGKLTSSESKIYYVADVTASATALPGSTALFSRSVLTCAVQISSRYGPPSTSRRSFLVVNSGN